MRSPLRLLISWEKLQGILAFNLGIELMQLIVIACFIPSLLFLSRTRVYSLFRIIGSAMAVLASSGWILKRISGRSLGIDQAVIVVANRSCIIASSSFCFSLGLYLLTSKYRFPQNITP